MQSNGCRSWRWTEEKATRRGGGLTTEETSCGGETGDWNWLQVAEQEERRRRKSAGERGGTDGVCFAAGEELG